ncbi:uncharacterized protein STEHIDRAFT_143007 [Stereum hirsutum FP-91666 SS1]|uniref:Uncharacterized protein n=1 Tax=Stereum hirsutum (strain FP-91666) TaxID=721885 RepID=R7RY38_STEHR|nr:uncharacterized protein STEHIDRAFT_143007 [Stereum hirsutum FP-91666 SS1]EIM80249.1 hypothetical protein STEHIDRAFT_143007 [Stereum hirsutum FP-91666 SS1]
MQALSGQTNADDDVSALSQLSSADGIDAEINALTTQIQALSSRLTSLRAVRNDRALISRLPYETMTAIFRAIDDRPRIIHNQGRAVGRPWLGWIYVSHVCRMWRDIAVRHSLLWSDISFVLGPEWTKVMFERSQTAPVNIDYSIVFLHPILLDKATLNAHMHHVRQLSLVVPLHPAGVSHVRDLLLVVSSAAHCLETLSLKMRPIDIPPADFATPSGIPIWSAGSFPRLRQLELHDFLIHWGYESAFPFRSLLTLKLGVSLHRGANLHSAYLPTLPTLLTVLDQMSELRVLHLNHILPSIPLQNIHLSPPPQIVSLPHLIELYISGKAHECADVRRCLEVPISTMIQSFNVTSQYDTREDLLMMSPFVHSFVSASIESCTRLALEDLGQNITFMIHMPSVPPVPPQLEFRCSFTNGRHSTEDNIVPSLLGHCSFDHLTTLSIRSHMQTVLHWTRVFNEFKAIKDLTIATAPSSINSVLSPPTINNFFDALAIGTATRASEADSAMMEAEPHQRDSHLLFPALIVVRVFGIDLTHTESDDSLRRGLLAALECRQQSASPIQSMQFRFCTLSSGLLQSLREIVPDVVVHPENRS